MIKIKNKILCEYCFAEIEKEPCPECGFNKASYVCDPTLLPLGSVLEDRYVIGRCIGKGGFGITYLAYDKKLEYKVAVKEYYPSNLVVRDTKNATVSVFNENSKGTFKGGADKFYDEARLVAQFNENPNVVSVHDFFYANDTAYFTMGFLKGMTLKEYLRQNGALSPGQAVCVANDISNALEIAHGLNVLHRDISPDNIMVCSDGMIKLLDFGAARQIVTEGSQSLSVILKRGYAPLEQYQKKGKQGPWTDIYSLGGTLYHALTLDLMEDPLSRLEDDSEYASNKYHIDAGLWEVIKKATALKSSDRYQDISEFRKDIDNLNISPVRFCALYREGTGETDMGATMPVQTESENIGIAMPVREESENIGKTMPLEEEADMQGNMGMQEESAIGNNQEIMEKKRFFDKKNMKRTCLVLAGAVVLVVAAVSIIGSLHRDTPALSDLSDNPNEMAGEMPETREMPDGGAAESENGTEKEELASEEKEQGDVGEGTGSEGKQEDVQKADAATEKISGTLVGGEVTGTDVFGNSELSRSAIETVTFLDTQEAMGENAWDVSKEQDGSVMAWTDEGNSNLYIAGEGNIAIESAEHLFADYANVREISFNNVLDTRNLTNMHGMFAGCEKMESLDLSSFDTSHVTSMVSVFYGCSSLSKLDLRSFDTSKVTDMQWMFAKCLNLESLDLSSFDTSRVRNMNNMFQECSSLSTLDVSNLSTGKVESMNNMFSVCSNLEVLDLSSFDTSKVTDMGAMFSACSNLRKLDVSSFDTSQTVSMVCMFGNCSSLETLDLSNFDTGQVENMNSMFGECGSLESLDVSSFDTSHVTDMGIMFWNCESLESLDISSFGTSRVTNMEFMFGNCSSLEELDLGNFDTIRVENMKSMFSGCKNLSSLDVSSFDTSQVTNMEVMFYRCRSLETLDLSNFDTAQVKSMYAMFWECENLKRLDVTGFDTSQVMNMENMFYKCSNLETLDLSGFNTSRVSKDGGMFEEAGITAEEAGYSR